MYVVRVSVFEESSGKEAKRISSHEAESARCAEKAKAFVTKDYPKLGKEVFWSFFVKDSGLSLFILIVLMVY
jgi:uncharacterized membrane protein